MATISLCMIVKNEAIHLGACLDSVKGIADQTVVVDTGSTDETKKIALSYNAEVYDYPWHDDFSAARNYSFSKATMDYILWMDADDIFLPKDREKLIKYKSEIPSDADVVYMTYNTGINDKGEVTFSFRRERLLKRSRNFRWHDPVHEYMVISGNIVVVDIAVTHSKKHVADSKRNLMIYEKQISEGAILSPRSQFYYARELKTHGENKKSIEMFTKFLENGGGWKEDNINACLDLADLYVTGGNTDMALSKLYRSFLYDIPRSEVCCAIGKIYFDQNELLRAAYWYERGAELIVPDTSGFVSLDYYNFIPNIQLCLIYDRLHNPEKARYYHELTKAEKPDHPSVLYNERYFSGINDN